MVSDVSRVSNALFFFRVERKVYIEGITNRVSTNENKIPPMITIPNGILLVDASPSDSARGRAPNDIAKLVMIMGLNLLLQIYLEIEGLYCLILF